MEALRSTTSGGLARRRHRWSLARARRLPVQVWMGVREACRPSSALLTGVLAVCALTMVLPASAYTTLEDPRFITYLGIGEADIRIDVYSGSGDLAQVEDVVGSETRITHHTTLLSRRYEMAASEGQWESVVVEVGDHDAIPLSYVSGEPPTSPDEVALSTAQAEAVGVETGARVPVRTADGTVDLTVTGTYQDITNGGRTAKAVLDDGSPDLWQVVYADLEDPQQGDLVVDSLRASLPDAQVRTTDDYASQVLGATSSQLRTVAVLACAVALGLAFLVTTLLTTLLVSRERQATAVLSALGCTRRDVTLQYLTRFMTITLAGLALGGLVAATAGQQVIGGVLSALGGGGAQIQLLARPWLVGGAVPLALAACVAGAVLVALRRLPAPTLTTLGAGE
ncbi:ABC transporter permease [Actinomyces sp. 2119]|uniref:ABC transporter permease n=1 Tax=Actinomyces lilanjuaniae TaxID=2321394 RepID=A0ABM6Z356_9ACTO|nr:MULTISPECIES: ABC transporter permease [Actinomyces]AYD89566.1 ABC transporter permease [Actinomyces lilanjuaniae]RJF43071.1 ABC transporter permease [Actinomyces sp. 2119]